MEWLADPAGPRMINLYASESPDSEGHRYGPDSPEVTAAIETCDRLVGRLLSQLDERGLRDRVDVIITSDHGMSRVYPENQTIFLEDFEVDLGTVEVIYPNSRGSADVMLMLRPLFEVGSTDTERAQQEYKATKLAWRALSGKHPKMSMYHKEKIWNNGKGVGNGKGGRIPERLHYNDNDRIMPLIAVADTGYLLAGARGGAPSYNKGTHGFDPESREMHPFFLATGPSFLRGAAFEAFPNVDIYPLLCELLGIEPAPNNGSLANVAAMLAPCAPKCAPPAGDDGGEGGAPAPAAAPPDAEQSGGSGRAVAGLVGFLIGVGAACVLAFVLHRTGRLRLGGSQPYVAVSDGAAPGADLEFSKL